jgi:hypothetical protein
MRTHLNTHVAQARVADLHRHADLARRANNTAPVRHPARLDIRRRLAFGLLTRAAR